MYAVIVGSFESTETLFSGTYYWLPHAPTLDNFRTVIQAQSGNVLTSLIVGVGTALLALVVAVPAAYALSKYRLRVTVVVVSALLVAQIVPSIVLATSLFREVVDAFCGRYVDQWERRDGRWGVTVRDVVHEWSRGNAFGTEAFPVPPSEDGTFVSPVRGPKDISYRR